MEKINNIKIKNFKSLRDVEINDCRRVNVFIGYPNVGKSNILEALGLMGFLNYEVYPESNLREVTYEITLLNKVCRVDNHVELFYNNDTSANESIIIQVNNTSGLQLYWRNNRIKGSYNAKMDGDELAVIPIYVDLDCNMEFDDGISPEETVGEIYKRRSEKLEYFPRIIIKKYDYKNEYQSLVHDIGDELGMPNGDNLVNVISQNKKLRKDLAEVFSNYNLKLAVEKSSRSIKLLKNMEDDSIVIIPYHQIADTLRRLVFYKAAIYSNSNSVLLFEEPEAHMFPPYISKFAADVMFDKNNNQYFISTHSPFVLNDFIEELDKEELAIYAVGYKKETGETVVHRITDEEMDNIYQYGIDLFFNLENYLKDAV